MKNKKGKGQRWREGSYSERMRDKWFCWAFKFLQLICKCSLICKSNLELALSIILRGREL